MELDNTRTIHEEAFMHLRGQTPQEAGFEYFTMYHKWYVYGKSQAVVDAFVKYRKSLRESWILMGASFPFILLAVILGLFLGKTPLILLTLVLSIIVTSIVTSLCRDNDARKKLFSGNIIVINKSTWTLYDNC